MKTNSNAETTTQYTFATPSLSRRVGRAGVLAVLIASMACSSTAEPSDADAIDETAEQSSALIVGPGTSGTISHVSPKTEKFTNTLKGWQLIPGLSGAVQSKSGDSLMIRVSAEMLGGATARVRAKIDGAPLPEVIFKRSGETSDEVRDFVFVRPNVTYGQHIVEIEWKADDDVMIRARSMTVESLPSTLGGVASATGEIARNTNTWADVPGMTKTITTNDVQDFAITFSADSVADTGSLFVRAIVDGSTVSEVAFVENGTGSRHGARSYTFLRKNVLAGSHEVKLQWRVEGGSARLGPRTLAVSAGRPTGSAGLDAAAFTSSVPTTYTSAEFVTVLNDAFTTQGPNSSAILSFGAEIKTNGPVYLRALVDGVATSDAPVQIAHGGDSFRVATYNFRATNLAPGYHSVAYQIAVDPPKSATVRRKFQRVLYRPRSGAELVRHFATAFFGGVYPRQQARQLLAICFDPMREGHAPPPKEMLRNQIEGAGFPSFKSWLAYNSIGRFELTNVRYVGCEDGNWLLAPPERRGNWYWDNKAWPLMWEDALKAADAEVDFHAYDVNGDNKLSPDEIGVLIIRPQNSPYGTVRSRTVELDGKAPAMKVHFMDLYLSSMTDARLLGVGVMAHEGSHLFLGTPDIYGCDQSPYAPGKNSVMYDHSRATSLDPFFKMKSGWAEPSLIDIGGSIDQIVEIPSVAATGEIVVLHNRARGDGEYFILENRAPSDTFDNSIVKGIHVWHVIEDDEVNVGYPPPAGANCKPGSTRLRHLLTLGNGVNSMPLYYADGSATGVTLTSMSFPGFTHQIRIQRQ